MKEAGAEGLSFELLNRTVDQPYKYVGTWLVDEWSKIGLHVTQRVMPTGPELEALRTGNFEVASIANCRGVPNPLLDVQTYLPNFGGAYGYYDDPDEVALYDKMLRETDFDKQRGLMRQFEKYVVDDQAHQIWIVWWNRIIPYRSYVKGWKIGPKSLSQPRPRNGVARQITNLMNGMLHWEEMLWRQTQQLWQRRALACC